MVERDFEEERATGPTEILNGNVVGQLFTDSGEGKPSFHETVTFVSNVVALRRSITLFWQRR